MTPLSRLLRRYVDLSPLTRHEIAAAAGIVTAGQLRSGGSGYEAGRLNAYLLGEMPSACRLITLATILKIPDAELCAALRAEAGIGEPPCA